MTIAMAHWQFTLLQTSFNQEIAYNIHIAKNLELVSEYM